MRILDVNFFNIKEISKIIRNGINLRIKKIKLKNWYYERNIKKIITIKNYEELLKKQLFINNLNNKLDNAYWKYMF